MEEIGGVFNRVGEGHFRHFWGGAQWFLEDCEAKTGGLCATFQFRLKSAQGKVDNQLTVFVLSSFNTTLHADLYYEPTMVINIKLIHFYMFARQ